MSRIKPLNPNEAKGKAKQLLDGVQAELGMTPNLMKTMAHSPAVLEAYLNFSGALASGVLPAKFREQLALAVAEVNFCQYCLSAHTALAKVAGLTPEEIQASRASRSAQAKTAAGLQFARSLILLRGDVDDKAFEELRGAGYKDGEIAEIVAHVALNILTNYFNHVAQTEIDFPQVPLTLNET